MRVRGLLTLVSLGCTLFASAALGDPVCIPGTKLSIHLDCKVETKGDAMNDIEESARQVLDDAREFSFETPSGVFGSVMAYTPKEEFRAMSTEWTDMMAKGIEDAIEGDAKITGHDIGKYGDRDAHFLTMELKSGDVECNTEFIVIGGKGEIILLAMTADMKDKVASAEQKSILASLTYEGASVTGRHKAPNLEMPSLPKPGVLVLQRK